MSTVSGAPVASCWRRCPRWQVLRVLEGHPSESPLSCSSPDAALISAQRLPTVSSGQMGKVLTEVFRWVLEECLHPVRAESWAWRGGIRGLMQRKSLGLVASDWGGGGGGVGVRELPPWCFPIPLSYLPTPVLLQPQHPLSLPTSRLLLHVQFSRVTSSKVLWTNSESEGADP